ncbi:DegV family protein [Collinsella sp. HCP28S3_E12]|uniref:DegV family protein n=1 Tax=unclassified Collinsella TaxID=2637548 RepID=UPI003F8B0795
MSFAIITDSTSGISPARAQELGIYVIPLHVIIEGEDLLDQVQASSRRCSIFAWPFRRSGNRARSRRSKRVVAPSASSPTNPYSTATWKQFIWDGAKKTDIKRFRPVFLAPSHFTYPTSARSGQYRRPR